MIKNGLNNLTNNLSANSKQKGNNQTSNISFKYDSNISNGIQNSSKFTY